MKEKKGGKLRPLYAVFLASSSSWKPSSRNGRETNEDAVGISEFEFGSWQERKRKYEEEEGEVE